jgi:protocatechuate 3,4-dioxygenase beta subunit
LRTDPQGKFRFESVPLNQALLLSLSKEGLSNLQKEVSLTAPNDVDKEFTIKMKPRPFGGSVRGTVRDTSGKPIAGAAVINEGPSSREIRKTTTDADGNYELNDVFSGSVGYELIAKAQHFAPQRLKFAPGTAAESGKADITLAAGQRIRGRVVDESGKPIREAQVYFSDGNYGGSMNFGGGLTTGADGRFEFDSLPPDTTFNVTAVGYPGVQHLKLLLGGNDEVAVTLKSEGVIKGRVVDAVTGKPISPFNVQLTFSPDRKPTDVDHPLDGERATSPAGERITDPDGTFLLNNLARSMPLQVTVAADGYEHVVERRIEAAAPADAKVVEIHGRIVMADGKPAAGVELRLISAREIKPVTAPREIYNDFPLDWQTIRRGYADRATGVSQYISTVSRPDGSFEFPAVKPAAATEVVYWGDGISRGRLMDVEKLVAADRSNLTIKMITPGVVRGAVDQAAASKISGVQLYPRVSDVQLHSLGGNDFERFVDSYEADVTRGDTSYEIRNVPSGDYELVVLGERIRNSADGFTYNTMERRQITVRSAETTKFDISGSDLHSQNLSTPTPANSN